MFGLLAMQASAGVILMLGGPSRWDNGEHGFEFGQWLRGRVDPEKCDVSPDGTFRPRGIRTPGGCSDTPNPA